MLTVRVGDAQSKRWRSAEPSSGTPHGHDAVDPVSCRFSIHSTNVRAWATRGVAPETTHGPLSESGFAASERFPSPTASNAARRMTRHDATDAGSRSRGVRQPRSAAACARGRLRVPPADRHPEGERSGIRIRSCSGRSHGAAHPAFCVSGVESRPWRRCLEMNSAGLLGFRLGQ